MLGRSKSRVVDVVEEDGMSVNINIVEGGGLTKENNEEDSRVNCTFMSLGWIGGPLLTRLYFLHGGNGIWLSSWLQMAGFPILVIPLVILYFRLWFVIPSCIDFILLFTTQLISTSFVSYFWVKQKFTPYSINAIVVIIMGCILLGIRGVSDHPPGVTKSQYLRGFFISIASASSVGFILVSTQVAYAKANQVMTYPIVLQFQFWFSFFATVSCTVGGLINKDFLAIQKEASEYDLGAKKYYLVLVSMAVVWQLQFIGRAGVIFCTSSLFAGIAAVITFHESFTAEKGMALALTLWGFTSYFYGSYTNKTKARIMSIPP
ncbi:hypothetical protein MKW92_007352 [Papaver armeniacum]|nr:hypothetical protein MKW92_007352 [Papaver armeniacum]